ncbi:hypothetical protein CHU_2525 [Cytophaga hutchinsonii ATCC 33406]|uniref:Uncharacterized protein n=1 Tax=Cytophaga hutchinsonii (strain ATCC 33406 / DSM 1761 / CIP 103989 / NBRC 15051 / NCIMB 9469 / D465) TaxID=269798 RepID=A0A6N4STT4_CYTH3|nr:hypothetical protein CHU_2525 [Cytophaga hutchinsonii ATCC 33406]
MFVLVEEESLNRDTTSRYLIGLEKKPGVVSDLKSISVVVVPRTQSEIFVGD